MTDKKFTAEEIKKALECCNTRGAEICKECPCESNCMSVDLYELALSLIKRYEIEIERLKEEIEDYELEAALKWERELFYNDR